jgi:hypothetical protein
VIKKILEQIRLTLKLGGILVVTEPVWTDRHVDLGLADELENTRVHDAVLAQAYKTCRVSKTNKKMIGCFNCFDCFRIQNLVESL